MELYATKGQGIGKNKSTLNLLKQKLEQKVKHLSTEELDNLLKTLSKKRFINNKDIFDIARSELQHFVIHNKFANYSKPLLSKDAESGFKRLRLKMKTDYGKISQELATKAGLSSDKNKSAVKRNDQNNVTAAIGNIKVLPKKN